MVRIGVVGYGYWGPNLVRNFYETPGAEVVRVADLRAERLKQVQVRYPDRAGHRATERAARRPSDRRGRDRDAGVHPLRPGAARRSQAGKHVFVEKPIAASGEQVAAPHRRGRKANRVLMVDHTFVYTGAVRKIRELVDDGSLGDIYYYDSTRVNLGLFQHDVNVVWDLAVHDLSIMDYVMPASAGGRLRDGSEPRRGQPENVAYLTLFFDGPLIAHLHVNWLAPVKIRRTLIGGSRKMIVYDDLEPSEKVKVYDKGITLNRQSDPARSSTRCSSATAPATCWPRTST